MFILKRFLCQKGLQQLQRCTHTSPKRCTSKNDEPIDENYHFLPLGKGDVGLQTRVSFLSKDMSHDPNKVSFYLIF